MKKIISIFVAVLCGTPVFAENYLLNGGQDSRINYRMVQEVKPAPGVRKLILNYVAPRSFKSPTYSQTISGLDYRFSPAPTGRKKETNSRGNQVIEVSWENPTKTVTATISLTAANSVNLRPMKTSAPFPPENLSKQVSLYLQPTEQVSSDDGRIKAKARELTKSALTEFDAVQQILTWVVDHMHYVLIPKSYDSLYSFKTGKGNCQNYSHLTAALMRAVGIPVRIINGVTLKQAYDIKSARAIMTMKMAEGRHSWIEVYFPDLGWVPFDPQSTELFVSNRFIRVEVGLDNNDTEMDGLMRWARIKGSSGRPVFSESINADFVSDTVKLVAEKTDYGPRGMLLCPRVEASFKKTPVLALPPPPPEIPEIKLKKMTYTVPFVHGNLEFPENVDFLSTRGPAKEDEHGTMTARKNFMVETAEYVTTQGRQYAQTFILDRPVKLKKIGLALHKFSDDGQLWLELFRDDKGRPGEYIATSGIRSLSRIKYAAGYSWMDFHFNDPAVTLSPGRYWVALGFTGSPIVNWFFTYGKPVGPQDGTRYRTMFDETWSRSLSFEFNYRVVGLTPNGSGR